MSEASVIWRGWITYCSICRKPFGEYGNNAQPINDGRCCDKCNADRVLPARIINMRMGKPPRGEPQ